MHKGNVAGMEADAAVGVGARRAVFQISANGETDSGQLAADLMVASGVQTDFHQPRALSVFQQLEIEHRMFRTAHLVIVGKGFVALLIASEIVGEGEVFARLWNLRAVGTLGNERYDGMIGLVHIAATEHVVESCEGFGSAGEDDDSTDGAIKAMHRAEKDFAGLIVLCFYVGFDVFGQGAIAGFVALNDFARGFVDDDHMIVFVKDFHLYIR